MNCEECHWEPDAKTDRTRKNIYQKLKKYLGDTYDKASCVGDIMKLQGFSPKHFDYVSQVENFMLGAMNDSSVNPNANKSENNMVRVSAEAETPFRKLIGHDLLYRVCKDLYGKDEADRLLNRLYSYDLYICDSSGIPQVYCYAIESLNLCIEGRKVGPLQSAPCKHLHSYISTVCGTAHTLSSNVLMGACGIADVFIASAYVLLLDKYKLEDVKSNSSVRKMIENYYQQLIYDFSDPTRAGAESIFSNVSVFDRFKNKKFVEDKLWLFDSIEDSIAPTSDVDYLVDYIMSLQDIFMDVFDMGDVLHMTDKGIGMQFEFPVVTVTFSKDDNNNIMDDAFLSSFCKRQVNRYNIMTSKGMHISTCCRLSSDVSVMAEANSVNTFGGGMMDMGSHRVIALNTNRYAIIASNYAEFKEILKKAIKDTACILKAHKELLIREEKAGLQPYITGGIINMDHLFSTFGIIGTFETIKTLESKGTSIKDIDIDLFTFINSEVDKVAKEYGLVCNIEQLPGETLAVKMAKADKVLFGDKQPYYIYSNQFIPLTEPADIFERMEADGRVNELITGGGIVHITTSELLDSVQAEKIIRYACKCNNEFFAINTVYSICSCGKVTVGKVNKCAHCGSDIVDYGLRVVGFLTKVSNWTPERRKEFKERYLCKLSNINKLS